MLGRISPVNNIKDCGWQCATWVFFAVCTHVSSLIKCPPLQESTGSVPQFVQHIASFADSRGTWQFEVFWRARREVPPGDVMYKWRAVAVQVWAVYSHYLQASSSHAVGEAWGRSGVSCISGPCGSIERLGLGSGSLTRVVITLSQQFHINDWRAVQVRLGLVCGSNLLQSETSKNKRTSFTSHYPVLKEVAIANGHSPGTPAGKKASNHINVNSWLVPVGWLFTDGGELCVMCLTSLKLTQINLRPSHYWLQGSARWSLMRTVENDAWRQVYK